MSDLSVRSDTVWHLNNLFILQFNMRLLTLQPLIEPHHSSLHRFICLTTLQSLSLYHYTVSVYPYPSGSEGKRGQTLCVMLHCEVGMYCNERPSEGCFVDYT